MCEGGSDAIASDGTSQIPVTCVQSQGIVSEVSGGVNGIELNWF